MHRFIDRTLDGDSDVTLRHNELNGSPWLLLRGDCKWCELDENAGSIKSTLLLLCKKSELPALKISSLRDKVELEGCVVGR